MQCLAPIPHRRSGYVHLMHPTAGVRKVHPRSGGPLDARMASSRFRVVAQSRCPSEGQVGDMNNSVVSPSDNWLGDYPALLRFDIL